MTIQDAVEKVNQFKTDSVTKKIKQAQQQLADARTDDIKQINESLGVDRELLAAAAAVKHASAQIDVVIHAAGILYALPHILEDGEVVQSVSLGADNANSPFDLVTDQRVAEFKFIRWQKKGNAVREKTLFQDFFKLAREETEKRKYLYLLRTDIPERFLTGERVVMKVLDRSKHLADNFTERYGETYQTVGEYYAAHKDDVHLVNLTEIAPGFDTFMASLEGNR